MKKIVKQKFKIEGMHCSSCAMSIDFDLEDVDGVKSSKTSYAKQICEVEYEEGKANSDKIIKQIKQVGYKAQVFK
jgi:copper chaperone CopZ